MRFADFIDRLIEIQNEYDCDDVEISIMEEHEVDGKTIQFGSKVSDIAVSVSYREMKFEGVNSIVIIGQEID